MQIQGQECQSPWGTSAASNSTIPALLSRRAHRGVLQCWCQHCHDYNCQESEQPKTLATNEIIMAEQRTFITDLPHRLWRWQWSKLQHPTTVKRKGTFWRKHPARTVNIEADLLWWQPNQETWFHHSVSLPWQWEIQSPLWSSRQQWQHDSRQRPSLEDDMCWLS